MTSERYTKHEAEVEAEALRLERHDSEGYADAEKRIDAARIERDPFVRGIGISFSAEREGSDVDARTEIEQQLAMAERGELHEVQIDLRFRSDDDFPGIEILLRNFHERHPDIRLSLHIMNPRVEGNHLSNRDVLQRQLALANELGSVSTIHPPSIRHETFTSMSLEDQQMLMMEYAELLAESAMHGRTGASVAVENMPIDGREGRWGQTVEEMQVLIEAVTEQLIEKHGFTKKEASRYCGITLDINHALTEHDGKDPAVIERWFTAFGDRLKAIHVYTPSLGKSGRKKQEFEAWFGEIAALYRQNHSHAVVYLESKKDAETTLAMHTFAQAAALSPRTEQKRETV